MAKLLGIRAYARRRGVTHRAVQKAISAGRLQASVTEDDAGRVRIDPEKADLEWEASTNPSLQRNGAETGERTEDPPPTSPTRPEPAALEQRLAGPNFAQSHAIREAYLTKIARLNYEESAGSLVKVDEVRTQTFKVHRMARDALLNIPERISAELFAASSVHDVHQILVREINAVLQEMVDAGRRS